MTSYHFNLTRHRLFSVYGPCEAIIVCPLATCVRCSLVAPSTLVEDPFLGGSKIIMDIIASTSGFSLSFAPTSHLFVPFCALLVLTPPPPQVHWVIRTVRPQYIVCRNQIRKRMGIFVRKYFYFFCTVRDFCRGRTRHCTRAFPIIGELDFLCILPIA